MCANKDLYDRCSSTGTGACHAIRIGGSDDPRVARVRGGAGEEREEEEEMRG